MNPKAPLLEPLTVLSFVAACTTKIRLGTAVLVLPHRNAVVTAKTVATLDVLSRGRVILGVGVGWMEEEFKAVNASFADRGPLSDEAVAVMKELWTSEHPTFSGRFPSFSGSSVRAASSAKTASTDLAWWSHWSGVAPHRRIW
jgi:alkanesulfonate monooxygenase SsuD/methylene tetrahydromethanopterin reductase-like flavin-dependent oxidoreductase (luciferase family)